MLPPCARDSPRSSVFSLPVRRLMLLVVMPAVSLMMLLILGSRVASVLNPVPWTVLLTVLLTVRWTVPSVATVERLHVCRWSRAASESGRWGWWATEERTRGGRWRHLIRLLLSLRLVVPLIAMATRVGWLVHPTLVRRSLLSVTLAFPVAFLNGV